MPMESKFNDVDGYRVHYWEGGKGFPLLMLHGVGPGTSIIGNYGPVLEPLAAQFHIVAPDLIGFGKSDRKRAEPFFDVDLWIGQGLAMLELLPAGPVGVAGHSLGGALALKLAARSGRVVKVMTSSSVGAPYSLNTALDRFWTMPADRAELRQAMQRMVADPAALTDAMIEDRWTLLNTEGYGAYFSAMFAPPRQRYLNAGVVSASELQMIKAAVLMLHGRNDQPCPAKQTTLALAENLARADVRLLANCGHNLPRERSADYLDAALQFFGRQS
jgi:2-hydroxymuconate-semialdehyde hydrolase